MSGKEPQRPRCTRQDFAAVCLAVSGELCLVVMSLVIADRAFLQVLTLGAAIMALAGGVMAEVHRRRAAYYRSLLLRTLVHRCKRRPRQTLSDLFSDN